MKPTIRKIAMFLESQREKLQLIQDSTEMIRRRQRLWDIIDHLDNPEFWWDFALGVTSFSWPTGMCARSAFWDCETIRQLLDAGREEEALVLATALLDACEGTGADQYLRPVLFGIAPECFLGHPACNRRLYPRWRCTFQGVSTIVRAATQEEAQYAAAQVLMEISSIEAERVIDNVSRVPSYV